MNIGLGNIGLGGLGISPTELQRRIAQYQSGIGSVPAPTTAPVKAVAPKPTPVPYRGGPSAPSFGPKTTPVPYRAPAPAPVVTPKPAVTDNRVAGTGVDYVAPKPTPKPTQETNPFVTSDTNTSGLQNYRDSIVSGGADYNKINDVDNVDDYYDNAYEKAFGSIPGLVTTDVIGGEGGVGGGQVDYSPTRNLGDGEYRSFVSDVPEYLKGFKTVTNIADTKSAYGSIAGVDSVDDTSAVLSSHYGYDYKPAEAETRKFGGNLQTHTSSNAAELSEFQSLVRPILNEQIPYLQATEGLGYQDALMEAYKRDPMLQSLYAKYDVTPARQTKDGSSYLYDPMSYAEIRTKEVKDSSVKDAIKMAAIIAASVYGGGFLASSGMFGGGAGVAAGAATPGALGTGLAYGTASGLTTAVTGGDLEDVAKSFATAGITAGAGAYAKGLASNAAELGKAASAAEKAAQATTGAGMGVYNADALKAAADATKAFKTATDTANTFNKTVKGVKFITKAVSGDAAGAAISLYGDNLTRGALDKAGFNEEFLDKYNINQDDLTAGLVKTQLEIAGGAEVGDALISGLGQYIQEGGAVGPNKIKSPEVLSKAAKVLRTVGKGIDDKLIEPVKDAAKPIARGIRRAGKAVDDKVIEPILDPIKAAGSAVDDVTKPVREGVSDVVKDTVKATGLGVMDVIALLTGSRGAGGAGSNALAGSGVRGGTPGIVEEKTPELFKLNKEKKKVNQDELSEFLMGNNPIVNAASGGMIQSSYGDLFDTIHQPKQTSDSTLNELLRIVGSR